MARDTQIRERLFPGVRTFDPKRGGYAAIPFVLRRMQWIFDPRGWQVYCYVLMRIGPKGIGWLTMSEMSWDLGFRSVPKLKVYVDKLVEQGWLLHASSRTRDYFLAPNPVDVIKKLAAAGQLDADRLDAVDEVLDSLGWKTIQEGPAKLAEDEISEDELEVAIANVRRRMADLPVIVGPPSTEAAAPSTEAAAPSTELLNEGAALKPRGRLKITAKPIKKGESPF